MPGKITHEVTEDGVMIVLRHVMGAPSSMRVPRDEAAILARAILDDLGEGDGLGAGGRVLEIGRLKIDTANGAVLVGEQFVPLTPKEYKMVEALALRPGHTLTKGQLFNRMYPHGDEPEMKIVDVFICKVRHKLRPFDAERQIETVWGRGYRIVAEPTPGSWQRPYQPVGIQAAILSRLAQGPATFLDLWTTCPEVQQSTVRNAIQTLRARGSLSSSGDPRGATYFLTRRAAA